AIPFAAAAPVWAASAFRSRIPRLGVGGLFAALVAILLIRDARFMQRQMEPDSRWEATKWLNNNLPDNAEIAVAGELHFSRYGLRSDVRIRETNLASLPLLLNAS